MAEINDYHAFHNLHYVQYLRDPEDRYDEVRETYTTIRNLSTRRGIWSSTYCEPDLLMECFSRLSRLEEIHIDLSRCPSTDPLLLRIWSIPSTRISPFYPSHSTRLWHILSAVTASSSSLRIKKFQHDLMSLECHREIGPGVALACRHLESLDLRFDSQVREEEEWLAGLRGSNRALRYVPGLRSLSMGFPNRWKAPLRFGDLIQDFTWPELQTFTLHSGSVEEEDFGEFLGRHEESLRRLRLGKHHLKPESPFPSPASVPVDAERGIHFEKGSLAGLLKRLSRTLQLEHVDVKGYVWEGVTKCILENSHPFNKGLYDDDWVSLGDKANSDSREMESLALPSHEVNGPVAEGAGGVEQLDLEALHVTPAEEHGHE
jgi:hypothetical protein